jgi:hypothetical protein
MKTLLANKQTEEQKQTNSFVRYQFIMAMMNMDVRMMGTLLNKDFKYLGNKNNWQLLHWLKGKFSSLNPLMFHSKLKEGISLDYYPGAETFEFTYAPMEDNNFGESYFYDEMNENDVFANKNAFTINLVLLFEDGKILDIRVPKKAVSKEIIKKYQDEN